MKAIIQSKYQVFGVLIAGLFSFNANCETNWRQYEENNISISYIDIGSIRNTGDITQFKSLKNMKQKAGQMLSGVNTYEVKCKTSEIRLLKSVSYSLHFGNGKVIGVMTPESLGQDESFSKVNNEWLGQIYNVACQLR